MVTYGTLFRKVNTTMTLRHLRIFICVSENRSMTAASEVLHITQPSISQAISELENHYEKKFFDRISNKIYITESGKELLSYAKKITSLFDELESKMTSNKSPEIIRVGASVTIGTYILNGILKSFSEKHPLITIKSVIGNTKAIEEALLKNELDIGLVEGQVHNSNLNVTPFLEDELVLICGTDHKLSKVDQITLEALNNEDFIIRETGSGTRELFENIMLQNKIKWNEKWVCNNTEAIKNAVIDGMGLSILSQLSVENEIKQGLLHSIAVENYNFKRNFSIVHHKDKKLTQSMKEFVECCFGVSKQSQ